ncbi:MAG: hypothetical protein LBH45_07380 [Campylobacteraceae bacterium]|jgi:hypothetical protein|nr:hypothetical protein [Campylobacteraceae bacterium]
MAILFKAKKNSVNEAAVEISKRLIIDKKVSKGDMKALHVEAKSTHRKCCITAEQVYVNEHCGVIEGGDVEINHIKGGKVSANTVKVDFLEGGDITANYIYVNNLGSGNKIVSTNTIEINNVKGAKNSLVIKPLIDDNMLSKLSSLYDRVALFKSEFAKTSSQLECKLKELEKQKRKVQEHRIKIKKAMQDGNIPHMDLLMGVKEFNMNSKEYDTLIDVIKGLEQYIKEDEDEFSKLESSIIINGKIINNSPWKENNHILFILPKYDLEYYTKKDDNIGEIYLKYSGNNKFRLETKCMEKDSDSSN